MCYHFSSSGFHLAGVVKSFEVITQDLLPAPLCGPLEQDSMVKMAFPKLYIQV